MTAGLVGAVAGVLALSLLLLWALVMRPVKRLRVAMERAGAGDLGARVPVRSTDEMGQLARSWNDMASEVQRSREELEGLNRTLEQRVDEKTRQLEHTHRQMVVVEKMASLGKLAAVVAHEINNPLAGIRTYARLLRRQFAAGTAAPPTPEQAEETDRILQMVDGEAGRCGDIVRNLLAFSRQSGARLAEEDLSPVVERCRMLLKHQAEMLGVTLETRVAPGLPKVVCDAAQVQQVILALAMNALEATPSDGRVSIEAAPDGDGVRLAVADTGLGDPEGAPRPHLRALLHHQGGGQGRRARPRGRLRHRERSPRANRGRVRAGAGHHLHRPPARATARGRGSGRGRARPRGRLGP